MSKDYYDILGVSKTASPDEIKTAFRKKAHEHHPDKGGDAEKFKEYNEAYQVLGNPEKRKQYDQFGSAFQNGQAGGANYGGFSGWQNGGGFNMDFEDLSEMFGGFGDIFGFGGANTRGGAKRQARGRDLELNLNLDFKEAVFGLEKEIQFSKNITCHHCHGQGYEPGAKVETCTNCRGTGKIARLQRTILGNIQTQSVCPHCDGEGKIYSQKCTRCSGSGVHHEQVKIKVRIPAGINNGESIRLSGQGEAGQKGASAGDLYLRVKISNHPQFIRDGYDIKTEETISIRQAILGDKIDIETVNGPLKLKIPAGTQSGTIFKLKEKGIIKLHSRGIGDHFVKIIVKIPSNLSRKQKNLLEELDI
ncbi:MAG: molecular chaperone DnaJ [Candidatus Falkowbacteria bacterium]|nr:MAG: molecular chaperone DnaJ [Candidatus Falkowbacteria bacterium]